jgi:hypothetical protein
MFWQELQTRMPDFEAAYFVATGVGLTSIPHSGEVVVKPWPSFVSKSYRINVLNNKEFPEPPFGKEGWLLPSNYFTRVNDVIRTTFVVRYLDGVQEIKGRIEALAAELGARCGSKLEGTPAGYYAGHIVVEIPVKLPSVTWVQRDVSLPIEIQVTTQVKEVIKELLHRTYQQQRLEAQDDVSWQWEYESRPFAANYLGHILQYVEGRIMNVRRMDELGNSDD